MCLSSYLYHKQNPTPENWINKINPFNHDKSILKFLIKDLNISDEDINNLFILLDEIYDKTKTYYQNLLNLNEKEVNIEAIRELFQMV